MQERTLNLQDVIYICQIRLRAENIHSKLYKNGEYILSQLHVHSSNHIYTAYEQVWSVTVVNSK